MKIFLALVTATCLGCAGSNDILPKVGDALLKVKNTSEEVEQARLALESVYDDLCGVDMLPILDASGACPKIRVALDGVAAGELTADQALNIAIEAYSAINGVVKELQ